MNASIALGVIRDIINGAASVHRGPIDLFQLEPAPMEVPRKPQEPREKTVLQMRREAAGKIVNREDEPPTAKPNPKRRYLYCAAMNAGFAIVTTVVIEPFLGFLASFIIHPMIAEYMASLALLPIFIITRVINIFYFADIAGACMRRANRPAPRSAMPFSVAGSDFIVSILLEFVFLIQMALASHIPFTGLANAVVFFHTCMLYSLYSFEYMWMSQNMPLHKRIDAIQSRWPFFLGFGAPLALLTMWCETMMVSGCLFGLLFPLLIIASYTADCSRQRLGPIAAQIPPIKIFYPSRLVTDKIVINLSEKFSGNSGRRT